MAAGIIQLLPDHVANQIAAGEVVQRPASVVKELLENAIDSGALHITLNTKEAGKTLIQVIDNGKGMVAEDARLCFARHATSKIRNAEDLFSINTKGFRGEALASIAAVAHVDLKTKTPHQELGFQITVEGSKVINEDECVIQSGTTFSVKNLFYNIPARRNFLKSDTIEYRHIIDEFQRVALAHPQIAFDMYHNGSEVYQLPISNLRQRIVNVFGGKTNEKLVPIQESTENVTITGFIGKPEFSKKARGEQFFFVNNRFIKSGYLHHAVMSAFEGLLKDGTQPVYYIYLEVPAGSIDINIHPTKTEIKFDDEQALYSILRASVKHSLGQFSIAPVLDFERDATLDTPYHFKNKEVTMPTVEVDLSYNPFEEKTTTKKDYSYHKSNPSASWESLYVGLKENFTAEPITYETPSKVNSLFESKEVEQPVYRTYQLHRKYIVTPAKGGLLIVDQQRAHQRILYEQFLSNITLASASSQQLLFPLELYFSKNEMNLLKEIKDSLIHTGFIFESMTSEKITVSGLPISVSESEASIVIDQLLSDLEDGLHIDAYSVNDRIAKSMAKSLAVKTGSYLSEVEQETLINTLFSCKDATVSPFFKPTFVNISVEELDKKFSL